MLKLTDDVVNALSTFSRDDLIRVLGVAIDALIFRDRYNRDLDGDGYTGSKDILRAKESLKYLQENIVWDNVYDVQFGVRKASGGM